MTYLPKTKLKLLQSLQTPMQATFAPPGLPLLRGARALGAAKLLVRDAAIHAAHPRPRKVLLFSPFSDGQTEAQPTRQLSTSHAAVTPQSWNRPD